MKTKEQSFVLFGASGRTGKAVLVEASARGIKVRTLDRKNPSIADLRRVIHGTEGVIIVFGPRAPYTDIFCAEATKNILHAMNAEHVHRLICQTGAMIGDYPQNRSFLFEYLSRSFLRSNPDGYNDRVQQEKIMMNSSLDWTIIKPPRLTDSPDGKTVQMGNHIKIGLLSSVSRRSLARFIIDEFQTPRHIRKTIFVKN